ncbi:secondary thiamine-phosphate synthase enzyme YjbQ [Spirochaetota bacterium]
MSFYKYDVRTSKRIEMKNIDSYVFDAIKKSGISDGLCCVYTPHTTAGITINENADPAVASDILSFTSKMVPAHASFNHSEGNSDSHIKSSLVGASETIIVEGGSALLGTWQSVFFCEFDGPRSRKVYIRVQ